MSNYMQKDELNYVIDRLSPEPLYLQVGKILEEKIKHGEYNIDERLPSEEYFTDLFGVSRPTVNKAIEYLIAKRIVRRDKGRGTYIEDNNKFRHIEFNDLIGIMNYEGHTIHTELLQFGELQDLTKVPEWLKSLWKNKILYIKRVRHIDNVPFFITEHFLPLSYSRCLGEVNFEKDFLYRSLKTICGIELCKMEREVRVVPAEPEEINRLQLMSSSPVLKLTGIAYSHENTPLFLHITRFDAHKVILQGVAYSERHFKEKENGG